MFIRIILAILVMPLIAGCEKSDSSYISLVKNGTLEMDKSLTIGNAIDNYKYFIKPKWDLLKTENGKKVVVATCTMDTSNITFDVKNIKGLYMQFNFLTNVDKTFDLDWCGVGVKYEDGSTLEPGSKIDLKQCKESLKHIYGNTLEVHIPYNPEFDKYVNIREQQSVLIDGHNETWRLQWMKPPRIVCGPEDFWDSRPCGGFAFGETGRLELVQIRDGKPDEHLSLSNFFSDSPVADGVAVLRRWDRLDGDNEDQNKPGFASRVYARPVSKIINLGDYLHDGNHSEFVLQIGNFPFFNSILVGASQNNKTIHVFTTFERQNNPLILTSGQWESLKKAKFGETVSVSNVECGSYGSDTQETLEILTDANGFHVTKHEYSCPENNARKKELLKTTTL